MKPVRTVTAREFQHRFGDVSQSLKPGESLTVTKHGKAFGTFTRARKRRRTPNFLANLKKLGHSPRTGQDLIRDICDLS